MELRALRYFLTAASEENITKAADIKDKIDQGLVDVGLGCGTPEMTRYSRFPQMAYELGKRLR